MAANFDPGELESIMKTYDRLQQEFKDKGGYQYEADVRSVFAWSRLQPF